MSLPDLDAGLLAHFGFAAFRGRQRDVVAHFLSGGSALVLMATGEGKSLCYQLPALLGDGLTVVVSPLIALMDDQVAALVQKGIAATCVHSLLERHERQRRLQQACRGDATLPDNRQRFGIDDEDARIQRGAFAMPRLLLR